MLNMEELKQQLTEEQICKILRRLGSEEVLRSSDKLMFKTICHNIDAHEAGFNLVYYKNSKLFRCFSECGESFDIYGLVKKRLLLEKEEGVYKDDLYYFVLNHSDAELDSFMKIDNYIYMSDKYRHKDIEAPLNNYNDGILKVFNEYYCAEWIDDGIDIETMKKYNIKYSARHNKIIIPHYDINNNLIGIRGRALDNEKAKKYGKYTPIRIENKMYNHPLGLNLYGLNLIKDKVKKYGVVIIAEGEKSAMQANNFLGDNNIVCAACGSTINKWQVLLLIKHCRAKEIILAFDREENIDNKYFEKLYNICNKYKHYCNMSFIFDNKLLNLKESPFDRGLNTFNELLKKRIRVK